MRETYFPVFNDMQFAMPLLIFEFRSRHDRRKNYYLSIMHATSGWLCSPSPTRFARR